MLIRLRLIPGVISLLLPAVISSANVLAAQEAPAQLAAPAWDIRTAPDMDLWFHGLAVIGFQGFGPVPMYDSGYAAMVRADKIRRGLQPSLLDRNATLLKAAFGRDSTFEVMHFLPLYFLASGSGDALTSLSAVARGEIREVTNEASSDPALLTVVAGIIRTRRQRQLLRLFIDALQDERRVFYDDFDRRNRENRRMTQRAFTTYWSDSLRPSIAPFLKNVDASGGSILLSPPLGGEGRSIRTRSSPNSPTTTVVVVGTSISPTDYLTPAVSVVRELCFQIVHGAIEPVRNVTQNRVSAERMSSIAAVRCGAQALEMHRPSLLTAYKLRFLNAAGRTLSHEDLDSAFLSVFPISRAMDASIRRALAAH